MQTHYTFSMRLISLTILVSLIISACGDGANRSEIEQLKSTRDSISEVRAELSKELLEIEEIINNSDTSIKERVINITTLDAKPSTFEHFFTIQGVVETDQNAQIIPEVAGRITSIAVQEGDRVSKGQLMMRIDNRVISNQIDELKSRLSLAETVFKKQASLWEQKVGSEIQYLEAKNNFEALTQNLETLQAQSDLYSIKAPFGGIVDETMAKEGEMASPQMPAFRLVNLDDMYIKSDVTERYLSKIKEGDLVEVTFPSIGITEETEIDRIANFINPNNRTFKIRLKLDNESKKLKPNLLGELKIRDYINDSTVVIPASLVQMTPTGEEFVFILNDHHAKKQMIKSGMRYNNQAEVLEGLKGNETLINKGARSIREGEKVKVISE
ncbi:MAG: efflux RND transporter periplasmic adaptor subunit [Salibacteraceae bacterium]